VQKSLIIFTWRSDKERGVAMKTSRNLKIMASAFLRDESGQSTTEYVLLLLFVVVAVKSVGGQLKTKLQGILDAAFSKTDAAIQSTSAE
jgi:Flp pilus assembly pilin Flp